MPRPRECCVTCSWGKPPVWGSSHSDSNLESGGTDAWVCVIAGSEGCQGNAVRYWRLRLRLLYCTCLPVSCLVWSGLGAARDAANDQGGAASSVVGCTGEGWNWSTTGKSEMTAVPPPMGILERCGCGCGCGRGRGRGSQGPTSECCESSDFKTLP